MKISVVKGYLITEISIPLISVNKKELYEAFIAPFPYNKSVIYIKPEAPYFLTDAQKSEIGYLSAEEYKRCWKVNENDFICPKTFPIYTNYNDSCLLAALSNKNTGNCVIYALPFKNLIIKRNEENEYYFVFVKAMLMNVKCNGNTTQINLHGTGIIKIGKNCIIYNNFIQLAAHSTITVEKQNKYVFKNFSLKINDSNIIKTHNLVVNQGDLPLLNENFENIKQKIAEDKIAQEILLKDQTKFDIPILEIDGNAVILAGTIIVIVIVFKCKKKCGKGVNVTVNNTEREQQ